MVKIKMTRIFIWIAAVTLLAGILCEDAGGDSRRYLQLNQMFEGVKGFNPYEQATLRWPWENVHGYLQVRPGAHLFYWFYFADGVRTDAASKPLIIWIQGGPGFAASGLGNFAELGPLNMNMEPRNHTWVKGRNVLFIDHPVGTGFSYATNQSLLVSSDRDMAIDLSRAIKLFFRRHKEFRKTPAYLVGQSYGGKITARLGLYLHTAIKKRSLHMNFKGLAIGGGWVDPKESSMMQPEFLYSMGAIERNTYLSLKTLVRRLGHSIDKRDFVTANMLDDYLFSKINEGNDINFNNINTDSPYPALEELTFKINRFVKPTLAEVNQSLQWVYLSSAAYDNLKPNFLVPTVSFLEAILNNTKLKVVIYNGNYDVITPLSGASNWVHKLKWHGTANFNMVNRKKIPGKRNGHYKEYKHLSFWSVFGAGHWVPEDNPEAMAYILKYLTH